MKTLYALIFVCLSVPALADVLDITPMGADEENTAIISAPAPQPVEDYLDEYNSGPVTTPVTKSIDVVEAPQPSEDYVDEYNAGPVTTPVTKSIDVVEVQVAVRDDDTILEDGAYTADVTSPATPKIDDDKPIDFGLDFSADDEARAYERITSNEPSTDWLDWE